MSERFTFTVAGAEYTLRADRDAEYIGNIAAHLDAKVCGFLQNPNMTLGEAAILAGMDMGDEYYGVLETNETLRGQIKEQLEEIARLTAENTSLAKELERLKAR